MALRAADRRAALAAFPLELAALLALAAGVRFGTLWQQSLAGDELVTAQLVHRSLTGMLTTLPHSESTPPLYYVLAWGWTRVFGLTDVALKALSALAGTLVVPVAYYAARELVGRRAAIVTGALAAVSPVLVWYSQEARAYELLVLLSSLSVLFFARSLARPSRGNLWLWAGSSALALTSHYFAGFLVVGEVAVFLARRVELRRLVWPCAAVAAVAAALAPLAVHQNSVVGAASWIGDAPLERRLREVAFRFLFLNYNPGRTPLFLAACALALVLVWRGLRVGRSGESLALAVITLGLPLFLAGTGLIDVFFYRNLLPAWLPLAVSVAAGTTGLPWAVPGALVAGSLACTLAVPLHVAIQRSTWRDAVHALRAGDTERLVVLDREVAALYWPAARQAPAAGATVDELDLVDNSAATPRSLPGFALAQTQRTGNLYVFRFRSPRPRLVTPDEVARPPNAAFLP